MRTVIERLTRSYGRRVLIAVVVAGSMGLLAAPALAAPEWGIAMTHENGWGVQGMADPYTGSTTSFDRKSAFDTYTVTVTNVGSTASGTVSTGNNLICNAGTWSNSPAFAYQWLRNGVAIAAATANTYTVQASDASTVIQCQVTASVSGVKTGAVSAGTVVTPVLSPTPPVSSANPTISGTVLVGGTATCAAGTWAGGPTFAYQWLRNGLPILGASSSTYTLVAADLNQPIQCQVTATNLGGSTVADSAPTIAAPVAPTSSAAPVLSGTVSGSVGETEVCNKVGSANASPVTATYQWLRNGAPIIGATGYSYTLAAADEGTAVQCEIIASNPATVPASGQAAVTTTLVVPPAPGTAPPTPGTPTITGTPKEGTTITCASGTWTGSPTFAYQWLKNGVPISGATASTYVVQAADVPSNFQCQVTGTNAGGAALGLSAIKATSPSFTPSTAWTIGALTIGGTAAVGTPLSCTNGTWTGSPSFSQQWLKNGGPISGATASTYTTVAGDAGAVLQCQVMATGSGVNTIALTTQVVVAPGAGKAPPAPPTGASVKVTGTPIVGNTLACVTGSLATAAAAWSNVFLPSSFRYVWLRNGVQIPGADSGPVGILNEKEAVGGTYTLTNADLDNEVQCEVVASSPGGNTALVAAGSIVAPVPATASAVPSVTFPVSVSDQLPKGLILAASTGSTPLAGTGWQCTYPDTTRFTCTRADGLAPAASYPPITAHVYVEESAANPSVNAATVSGGGAMSATVDDPTTITPAVPYGVQSFTTSVTNSLGNPFTQAGGHPFAASAGFTFNYTTNVEGKIINAGGTPMATETELPPGFIGNPQNTPQCPGATFAVSSTACPANTAVGYVALALETINSGTIKNGEVTHAYGKALVYNLTPPPGVPAAFGFVPEFTRDTFVLYAHVRSDGDYGITVGDFAAGKPSPESFQLTFCDNGAATTSSCSATPLPGWNAPFLTNPVKCTGEAPVTTIRTDSYENQSAYAFMSAYTGAPSAVPAFAGGPTTTDSPLASSFLTGCNLLQFNPKIELQPETTQADEPTGMKVHLTVPQTNEESVPATPELKDAVVTLPEGMSVSPSAVDGLQACSDSQFGLNATAEPAEAAECPLESQIGTVKIISPLLAAPLTGQVYLGQPQCSPCSSEDAQDGRAFRLFLQAEGSGVVVKVFGKVSANPVTGRLQATFSNQPQLPFSELEIEFKGGARAPLANSQVCGAAKIGWDMTPWSAPGLGGPSGTEAIAGTPDSIVEEAAFNVDGDGHGGVCASGMGFSPGFSAGTASAAAGAYSPLSVTLSRGDREQDLAGVTVHTPAGMLGALSNVEQCGEPQAALGTCGAGSQIGTTTVAAGPGSHPYYISGRVYLTGPYKGAPFGLSIVVPAVAGPFNLGNVVVRASIAVDPHTAALTVTSDPFPQILAGVPLRLQAIHVEVNRPGFMFNATNCAAQQLTATITGEHALGSSEAAKTSQVSSPYAAQGCANLGFDPSFVASTEGKTSKADGASLSVDVGYPQGSEANIKYLKVELPRQLPSRLTTLQKACPDAQFEASPASCPAGSVLGTATAVTPVLKSALTGPAYFVSHGGAAFPDLEIVLQGEGVTVVVDGSTFISKAGVTSTTFSAVPDAPISSFQLTLPEGPKSALAANGNLCTSKLVMPTTIIAQNGKEITQQTNVPATGCPKTKKATLTRAQKLKAALKACKKDKSKAKRAKCEKQARKKYGPTKKTKKKTKGKGK